MSETDESANDGSFTGKELADKLREITQEAERPDPHITLQEYERWGKNIVRYNMLDEGGKRFGNFELHYSRARTDQPATVFIDAVHILDPDYLGRGYAMAAYKMVPSLPVPESMPQTKYVFMSSSDLSESAERVWQRLMAQGLAKKVGDHYEYVSLSDDTKSPSDSLEP